VDRGEARAGARTRGTGRGGRGAAETRLVLPTAVGAVHGCRHPGPGGDAGQARVAGPSRCGRAAETWARRTTETARGRWTAETAGSGWSAEAAGCRWSAEATRGAETAAPAGCAEASATPGRWSASATGGTEATAAAGSAQATPATGGGRKHTTRRGGETATPTGCAARWGGEAATSSGGARTATPASGRCDRVAWWGTVVAASPGCRCGRRTGDGWVHADAASATGRYRWSGATASAGSRFRGGGLRAGRSHGTAATPGTVRWADPAAISGAKTAGTAGTVRWAGSAVAR
jgi:collagen type I alpha